jgi:hypothetical protein
LLDFIVPNLELDGEKLVYQYKEPFEAIKEMVEKGNWRAVAGQVWNFFVNESNQSLYLEHTS